MDRSFNFLRDSSTTRGQYDYSNEKSLTALSESSKQIEPTIQHLGGAPAIARNPPGNARVFCNERTPGKCSQASSSFGYVAVFRACSGRHTRKCISTGGVCKRHAD